MIPKIIYMCDKELTFIEKYSNPKPKREPKVKEIKIKKVKVKEVKVKKVKNKIRP